MKLLYASLVLVNALPAFSQLPETDIFLADLKNSGGKISIGIPENITNRPGYDNQPSFSQDGKSILYVAVTDTTQSDVYRYDLKSKSIAQLTFTKESEYSPTWSSFSKNMSVVRVDEDKGQRFYHLAQRNLKEAELIKGTDAIGYYCELNDSLLAMFILGDAMTLQVLNTKTGERKLMASDIGRCLKLSNDKKHLLFVIKENSAEWSIYKMNIGTSTIVKVTGTLKDNEDFAILPNGNLLMGSEGKLFQYQPGNSWDMIADLTSTIKSFYRIAINSKGDKIAFVSYTGKKP